MSAFNEAAELSDGDRVLNAPVEDGATDTEGRLALATAVRSPCINRDEVHIGT